MKSRLIEPKPTVADVKLVEDIRRQISNGVQSGHAFTDKEAAQLVAAHVERAQQGMYFGTGRRAA